MTQEELQQQYKETEYDRFLAECQNSNPDFSDFDADDIEEFM